MIGECPNGRGLLRQHRWKTILDVRRCKLCGQCEVFTDYYSYGSIYTYWKPVPKSVYDEALKDALNRIAKEEMEAEKRKAKDKAMVESWQQP